MLNDTDILSGIYCHFIVNAPRYSVDFTNPQKEIAEKIFVKTFLKKEIEYPVGGFYEKYLNNFSLWAVTKHKESATADKVREWFDTHCQ
ncbi:hypothetical protein C3D66_20455 [Cronobacter sakazakii]|nr:hypothetical protein C3D66_20455 [Cronobacter sakazakii]